MTEPNEPHTSGEVRRTRTLILMRHAKAGEAHSDLARPLAHRGKHDAELVGAVLAQRGVVADLVLCSSATRTMQTWQHVVKGGGHTVSFRESDLLYDANYREILGVVRAIPETVNTAIIVGHFPGIPDVVDYLASDTGPDEAQEALRWGFTTASFVTLAVTGPWREIDAGNVELVAFDSPR